jgi:multidrug efflux pump subunit AcrA (membrane-fusion protein)
MTPTILRAAIPFVVLAAGVGVFAVVGQRPEAASRDDSGRDNRPLVATQAVALHSGRLDLQTDGIVVPFREITLAAEVAGVVVYKSPECNEGNFVEAGTRLIQVDPSEYRLEERRLQGELKQARVRLSELNVDLENAEQMLPLARRELALQQSKHDRNLSLQERRVVSQEQIEESERALIAARNSLLGAERQRDSLNTRKASLESAIEVGQVQLERAQLDLTRTTVKAPVSGVIIRDDVEQDSYVQPGAKLFAIEDTQRVEVRCNLRMDEMRWIWQQSAPPADLPPSGTPDASPSPAAPATSNHALPATAATVSYEMGGRDYTWSGRLDRYDGLGLDEKTRMVPCRIVVDRPGEVYVDGQRVTIRGPRSLVRGMFVGLVIHTEPTVELMRVPELAIQPGNVVWRVRNGKLERVALRIAQSIEDAVLVDAEGSGLQAGDRLVVSPLQAAFTGLEVREDPGS